MWILRFHLLKPKDYNKVNRICHKYGFFPRKYACIIFAKASVKHITQKISWRTLAREFGIDHIQLYKFYENAQKSSMLSEIFHVFLESRSALYIGDIRHINNDFLDNNQDIIDLTQRTFESIVKPL